MCRANPLVILGLWVVLTCPATSQARDPVRCEIKTLSEKLRDFCVGQRITEVAVGDVLNANATTPSTAGPGLRQILIEELQRVELKVRLKAEVGLTITYRDRTIPQKQDRQAKQLVIEMQVTAYFNKDNSQQDILSHRIDNEEAVRHILGLSVQNLSPQPRARAQEVVLAYDKPTVHRDGTILLAGDKSPFGVELLVDEKSLTPTDEDGFGMVKLKRDQTYAVRLINRSNLEMAVRLSIDGLNIFTFSKLKHDSGPYKGAPLYDMILIPPQGSVTVKGWHKDNAESVRFKITDYANTAAALMGKSTDIGTITATFCAAWEKTPPADEPDGSRAPGDDGTGFGAPVEMQYKAVQRTIGAVRASVAVRYRVPAGQP